MRTRTKIAMFAAGAITTIAAGLIAAGIAVNEPNLGLAGALSGLFAIAYASRAAQRSHGGDIIGSEPIGEHWTARYRRSFLGVRVEGWYHGPELDVGEDLIVWGHCWTMRSAVKQIGYWIEDAEANRAEWLLPAEDVSA